MQSLSFTIFNSLLFLTTFSAYNCRVSLPPKNSVASGASIVWKMNNDEPNNPLGQACAIFRHNKICWNSANHPELGFTAALTILDQTGNFADLAVDHGRWMFNTGPKNRLVQCDVTMANEETEENKKIGHLEMRVFNQNWNKLVNEGQNQTIDEEDVKQVLSFFVPDEDVDFPQNSANKNIVDQLQKVCQSFRAKSLVKKEPGRQKRSYLIFPGTNWCGTGNAAQYSADLGASTEADRCCRQHDQCPYSIAGFSSRFNLFNYRLHTLTHCECDKLFKQCLKDADSTAAGMIGRVYFNVVATQCFDLKLQKTCVKRSWWGTCAKQQTQWVAEMSTLGGY